MSNDDIDDDDISLDESFDEFEKKNGTLGDMMRENPLFKIGALVVGAIVIFVLISFLGKDNTAVEDSYVGTAPDITSTPGTEEATLAYTQAVEELNEQAIEQAFETGDSSLPVPIEPPVGIVNVQEEQTDAEDPLQRWRRLQEERLEREIQQSNTVQPVDANAAAARNQAIQQLSSAMSQQMASILDTKSAVELSSRQLTAPDYLEKLAAQEEEEQAEAIAAADAISNDVAAEVLFPAGKIVYAQLITEANTDVPGPILAEIMSGPLKGSRILGTFEEQNEFLTLNFDTIVYDDESLSIDAVALDPATTLPGMATEVDRRYFKRVILPAAAAFVEGLAEAVAESGRTTITIQGETVAQDEEDADTEQEVASGIEEAGRELGEILDEIADDTEVLVRIASGTPIGVLFLEPVTLGEEDL